MSDEDYLESRRKAIAESVEFFAPENKGQREIWVANAFLENLNVPLAESELVLVHDDPPDVFFRDAQFEIKEVMDPGRRRHTEYKDAQKKAHTAKSPEDLLTPFTPRDIALSDLYQLVVVNSNEHAQKYATSFCRTLDLLFYVNLQNVMGLIEKPVPNFTALQSHPWRSVSFVMGRRACVLAVSSDAPGFLRSAHGQVVHRQNPSV